MKPSEYPPFPGFRDEAFAFMRDLKRHNDRDWFKARKETFVDEVQWPMQCLVADLARRAQVEGLPYSGDPKKSIFRIYRDTRFSKDKSPYKTHLGAYLTRTGDRKATGGFYVHFEPGNSFFGAGFWHPENKVLRKWRARMMADPGAFLRMVDRVESSGCTIDSDDQLKRMPRGFDVDDEAPIAPYMRWKSFTVMKRVDDAALHEPAFAEEALVVMRDTLPLMEYGWDVLGAPGR